MAKRTRIFLLVSAGVLMAALATGLVAWAGGAVLGSGAPDELAYVPGTAQMVAYANVRQVMNSPFHDRFRDFSATNGATPDGLEARTGIQFDKDIDLVLIASIDDLRQALVPPPGVGAVSAGPSLVIARGRFDTVRIEALMRDQGAQVEQYRGKRVISIKDDVHDSALTFAEPGLLLFGTRDDVRAALDAKAGAAQGITANREYMALIDDVDEGTAWSVAKFNAVSGRAPLPGAVVNQLPPINWLAASGRIDSGLHGLVRAEAQDEQSARDLRDVVQGFLSLAKLQGSRDPAYKGMLDSVTLNAQGKSVSLSFDVSPSALDALSSQGSGVRRR